MNFVRNAILATTLLTASVNAGLGEAALVSQGNSDVGTVVTATNRAVDERAAVPSFKESVQAVENTFGMSLLKMSVLQGIASIGFGVFFYVLGLI